MKKILLVLIILVPAGAVLYAVNQAASRWRQQLQADQNDWRAQTQQLAKVQAEDEALASKVRELRGEAARSAAALPLDPALVDLLLTNSARFASSDMQEKLLAGFGRGGNSSGGYVLVTKALLKTTSLKPLKNFPNHEKLTDAVRGVLAITPGEQQSVEAAFADAFAPSAAWATANLQREGPSGDMLVRYTIPAAPAFEQATIERLFTTIGAVLGNERSELLRDFFQNYRVYEDGFLAARTNIFEIYRIPKPPGLAYRAGQKWSKSESSSSETINTYPEPIKPDTFPVAFRPVFPGGWQDVAKQEGFELPEGF